MTDPYKVLGVSPEDTDEKIKSVYRDLARKYHPDSYVNNPLADLASEKMKEINEAYDAITNMRKNNGYGKNTYNQGYSGTSQFTDIRNLINQNRITEAEELLDGVYENNRDAEWFFLKGCVLYKRGWINEAYRYYGIACQKNPTNQEYRTALNQIEWQKRTANPNNFGGGYRTTSSKGMDGCDICTPRVCADCCCECMGGDFISCC